MSDAIPDGDTLTKLAKETVFDAAGQQVLLGDLITVDKQTIVVFIRHFRCGLCQDYLLYLLQQEIISPDTLSKRNANLLIIGCGEPSMIKPYKELLNLPYEVYANPTASIYSLLDCKKLTGLDTDVKSVYNKRGFLGMVGNSISRAVKLGNYFGAAGNTSQLGGELVLEKDVQGSLTCPFIYRMKKLSDHSEASTLVQALR